MFPLNLFAITVVLYQLFECNGEETAQNLLWIVPDGTAPDGCFTYDNGMTVPLSWNNWSCTGYIDAAKNSVDLWVTSNWDVNQYAEVLRSKRSFLNA
jgi:hypothetical protein